MKKLFFLLPFGFCLSCGSGTKESLVKDTDSVSVENTEPEPEILDSNTVARSNAERIIDFSNDPMQGQSVVKYFFASQIRGDQKWKDVCMPEAEWSTGFKEDLAFISKKEITRFVYKRKDCMGYDCNVLVELEYSEDGKPSQKMEYMAFVKHVNDKWLIVGFTTNVHG